MKTVITTTNYSADSSKWLASKVGRDCMQTITLDRSAFTEATHYPDGFFKSGILLGKITATGLYGPLDTDLSNGQEVFAGILGDPQEDPGVNKEIIANLQWLGLVNAAKLPVAAEAANGGGIPAAIAYAEGPPQINAATGIEQLQAQVPTIRFR